LLALIWLPVAVYLLATGAVWQGIVLIAWGVLVIGLVDNIMRPILVGKDIKMPDYLVLVSTLGGLAVFGVNGFVIGPVIAAMFMAGWSIFATAKVRMDDQERARRMRRARHAAGDTRATRLKARLKAASDS
jgi:predicted PurR-regulated permease PerM